MIDLQPLFDWLVDGAPGAPTPVELLTRVCPQLVEMGIPVDHVESFVRTLHPHIVGRSFVWAPGTAVVVRENSFAYLQSAAFLESAVAAVCATGQLVRRRGGHDGAPPQTPLKAVHDGAPPQTPLKAAGNGPNPDGFSDYVAAPLRFLSGQVHAITFATRAPGGFTDAQVAALLGLVAPISRIAEIFALSRTAANLLNTYVGHDAGERIMAGHIQRGDTDTLRAVIWFSDLRGFTALSGTLAPGAIIRVLNERFECQVPAIERRGGEVLKFIGDGLLAIFPVEGSERPSSQLCDAALDAAAESFDALATLNQARTARGDVPIRFGLALHVGDLAYGNIGGAGRLDFTCIGPAVNLASRLEGLTGKLDRPVVVSREFAELTTRGVDLLGEFELKGVAEAASVYAPAGRLGGW